MQLSVITAIDAKMVTDRNDKKLNAENYIGKSSIDLNVRSILVKDDKGQFVLDHNDGGAIKGIALSRNFVILPQETVYIISEERINVPAGFVAYVFLKNRFSQKGLLALNTGIVDGGYEGPIATLLTNISERELNLKQVNNGSFFRVVFHQIGMSEAEIKRVKKSQYTYEQYISYKANELLDLPKYFQNPDKIRGQIEKSLNEKALNIGFVKLSLIIGTAGLLMILVPPLTKLVTDIIFDESPISEKLYLTHKNENDKQFLELKKEIDSLKLEIKEKNSLTLKKLNNTN